MATSDLTKAIADLEEKEALRITKARLDKGEDPNAILADSRAGMETVGKRFAEGTYFLPELIYSGEILKGVSEMVKPKLKTAVKTAKGGKVVAGPAHSSTLIENVMLGAMTPDPGPLYFGQRANKAVVLKSERPDLQIAAMQTSTACLVLAGKSAPIPAVLARAADTRVPVVTVADDVPTVVSRLETALRNAWLSAAKVGRASELVSKHVDLAKIDAALGLK